MNQSWPHVNEAISSWPKCVNQTWSDWDFVIEMSSISTALPYLSCDEMFAIGGERQACDSLVWGVEDVGLTVTFCVVQYHAASGKQRDNTDDENYFGLDI